MESTAATKRRGAAAPATHTSSSFDASRKRMHPSVRRGPMPSASTVRRVNDLALPHVQSYNMMMDGGLQQAVLDIPPREITTGAGETLHLWIEDAKIGMPMKSDPAAVEKRLLPAECREAGSTYAAPLHVTFAYRNNDDSNVQHLTLKLGEVPIMIRSSHCHLAGMNPQELVVHGEEAVEFGGYFICNGIERVIRMLQIPKRNFPMAITRNAYTNRGPLYSNKGVVVRCVRPDQSGVTLTLHYLEDGSATVRFSMRRQEFFLPVIMILKALVPCTDREIYERVLAGDTSNTYLSDRLLMLLRDAKRYESVLHDQHSTLSFLGSRFRGVLDMPASLSDADAGRHLLDRYILVHLPASALRDKFNLLILMLRKLYLFVRGDVQEDSPDTLTNQELLLSGHLILMFLKEKLTELLAGVEASIKREDNVAAAVARRVASGGPASSAPVVDLRDAAYLRKIIERQPDVGKKVYYLLATGNLVTSTGLDLMQVSGYTVVADKINFMRFTTHFRSVHRGQFFAEMKTTAVRKLLPENWGFLCPVHTPDGAPCGLLNHLSAPCSVIARPLDDQAYMECASAIVASHAGLPDDSLVARAAAGMITMERALLEYLVVLGMTPASSATVMSATQLPIMLDGKLLGWASPHAVFHIAQALRRAKALTTAVRAGIDRVGPGALPGQREEVCELVRACVLGFSDHRALASDRAQSLVTVAAAASSSKGSGRKGGARPDGIVPAIVLPPAMEVSLIPPPWWDAEVDPYVDDVVAHQRVMTAKSGVPASGVDGDMEHKSGDAKREADEQLDPSASSLTGLYPGLFLHTTPARLVRPVLQLDTGLVEIISPTEQPYMDIACTPEDVLEILHTDTAEPASEAVVKGRASKKSAAAAQRLLYTHIELSPLAMLSEVASFVPFSDLNQSPRNMYQCQMGKQTMGTPVHSFVHRTDTKLFRLQTPQVPIAHNATHAEFGMDEYPSGANAIVAVIAYTGYDMEDACIINKSSYERGFGHASVYKVHNIDLQKDMSAADASRFIFHNTYMRGEEAIRDGKSGTIPKPPRPGPGDLVAPSLDADGLPAPGTLLRQGDPMYAVLDTVSNTHKITRHKEVEPAYVDEVRILPSTTERGAPGVQRVSIKLRMNRNPIVGDKFSSRHGQKGVLSFLWPQEDMPFTDQGITPDVIINPHAFPSRMTIGMLVESMAGKAGSLHGCFQDASPFQFNERHRAVDYFGEQLRAAGYAYFGTETMYSGVTGEPLHCDIYLGVVYYQRLRHMVNDKAQVRATGPINNLTRQPVKGRKKHGGIRFGEMERDSLLAHGASFLLHDRLHTCSDRHIALVCKKCGSVVSTMSTPSLSTRVDADGVHRPVSVSDTTPADAAGAVEALNARMHRSRRTAWCRSCETGEHCVPVPMPYVFRYLANELAAMNIKIKLELGEGPYAPE